jgi:hypothetical protein
MKYEVTGFIFEGNRSVVAPITREQFDSLKAAKELCIQILAIEERINLVLDNYNELELDLLNLAQRFLLWSNRSHSDAMYERLLLDRRLVNLLSACRLYLDQTDHSLSDLFGKDSAEREKYKSERSRFYDTHFGYRLIEALRNHVQHYSLAVHTITYTQREATGPFEEYTVAPQISVAELEQNPQFKDAVIAELKAKGQSLDARGPIRRYVSCLTELHSLVRKLTLEKFKAARRKYCDDIASFSTNTEGEEVCNPTLVAIDDSKGELSMVTISLPLHFLGHYDDLLKRVHRGDRLPGAFASNGRLEKE